VSDAGPEPPPPPPPSLTPPPGYTAYTAGPGRTASLVRLRNIIVAVLVLIAASGVYQLIVTPGLVDKSKDFLAGRITESAYKDELAGGTGALLLLPLIACVVVSIIWLYQMIREHVEMGRRVTWGAGWAIGGWFLPPGLIYVIPMLVLRETWKAADPSVPPGDDRWKSGPVHPMLWVWWALYGLAPLVFIIVGLRQQIGNIGASTRDIADSFVDNAGALYAQAVVSLISVFAWAAVVWLWTDRHQQFARSVGRG
jgi:hypothetical protein